MRCGEAVIAAFLSHPRYGQYPAILRLQEKLGWDIVRFLPPESARKALNRHKDRLVAQQAKTGLWKPPSRGRKEHSPAISCRVVQGIHRAGMLDEIGKPALPLRYDPFAPFAERKDAYGVLVRRIFQRPLPEDDVLADRLTRAILADQRKDGSWDGTVVSTSVAIERLMELDLASDSAEITRAADWLLAQYRERVVKRKVFAESLFCAESGELESALKEIPETIPVAACYGKALPLIPTGLALRMLVATGRADDPRVEVSFASLLKLSGPFYSHGKLVEIAGWCGHQCVFRLEEEAKTRKT